MKLIVLCSIIIFFSVHLFAQTAKPDSSFNNSGMVDALSTVNDIGVQSTGKIIAATYNFIRRYNTNGTTDLSFGNAGMINHGADKIFVEANDQFVVASSSGVNLFVNRYNKNGSRNIEFGNNHTAAVNFDSAKGISVSAINIQPDDKILISGSLENQHYKSFTFVVRFNNNGTPDSSFGTNGKVVTGSFLPKHDYGDYNNALTIQPNGKIVTTGYVSSIHKDFGPGYIARTFTTLARYKTDGTLDSGFTRNGKVETPMPKNITSLEVGESILIQTDNKILVLCQSAQQISTDPDAIPPYMFGLRRYNADGKPDSSFGVNGRMLNSFGNAQAKPKAMVFDADGKIVAAGTYGNQSNSGILLVRYNANGTVDSSFGADGIKTGTPYFQNTTALQLFKNRIYVSSGTIIYAYYINQNKKLFAQNNLEITSKTLLQLFPNPAQNYFVINGVEKVNQVLLISSSGKIVKQWHHPESKTYYVNGLSKGLYFVKMSSNTSTIVKALVIQ